MPDKAVLLRHPGRRASDVVIVGGGLAGLFSALKLAPRPVTVLTAAPLGQGASSAWAQGGIAAAVGEGDTPESASVAERNFATAALLIAAAAWRRRESRGGHYRSDHPAADPAQAQRSFLTLQRARAIAREATETSHAHVAAA